MDGSPCVDRTNDWLRLIRNIWDQVWIFPSCAICTDRQLNILGVRPSSTHGTYLCFLYTWHTHCWRCSRPVFWVCLCFEPAFHTGPRMEFSTCVSMWIVKTFWVLEEFGFLIFRLGDVQPVGPLEKYLKCVDRHTRTCTLSHLLSNPGIQAEMTPCPELEGNSGNCEMRWRSIFLWNVLTVLLASI